MKLFFNSNAIDWELHPSAVCALILTRPNGMRDQLPLCFAPVLKIPEDQVLSISPENVEFAAGLPKYFDVKLEEMHLKPGQSVEVKIFRKVTEDRFIKYAVLKGAL